MAGKLSYRHIGAKAFSHSRLELLDSCPRKFELEGKLNIRKRSTNLTFAYGHAFGEGIQGLIEGKSLEQVIFEVFANWEVDITEEGFDSEKRNNKHFYHAIDIICLFNYYLKGNTPNLEGNERKINWTEWEIAYWVDPNTQEEKPAVELELEIDLGNGFYYEGHIDLVVRHKTIEKYMVVEIKSSGLGNIHPALYGNSPQPTGYMMALDSFLAKENKEATTSFDVLYLVGQTKNKKFYEFLFTKTPLHRTQWLTFIISKMEQVDRLEDSGLPYPINFKSCFSFNRPCEHFGTCHLPNDKLVMGIAQNSEATFDVEETLVDIQTSLASIIERQQQLLETYEIIEIANEGGTILLELDEDNSFDSILDSIQIQ